jgi:hypothetical protein
VISHVRGLAAQANRALDHAMLTALSFDGPDPASRHLHQNSMIARDATMPPNLFKGTLDNALRKAGVNPRMAGTQLLELLLSGNR